MEPESKKRMMLQKRLEKVKRKKTDWMTNVDPDLTVEQFLTSVCEDQVSQYY